MKADFTRYGIKFWLMGKQDNENRRAYREFNVARPMEFPRELLKTYITDMEQDKLQWEQIIEILSTDKDLYVRPTLFECNLHQGSGGKHTNRQGI